MVASAVFGTRLGWQVSFINHAIMNFLWSNPSTWRWLLSWQGYDKLFICSSFILFFFNKKKMVWCVIWFINIMFCLLKRQDAGMDWILHLDTDELIHPAGGREYSLRQLLLDVPRHVDMVIFPNYVSRICWFFLNA